MSWPGRITDKGYNWELYHIDKDFSQATNLAAKMPQKFRELQDLFYVEARNNDVLPLDNSTLARFMTPRPSPTAGRSSFTYTGELSGVPAECAPSIPGRSYNIEAEVEIPEGGAEGMIATEGGRFGGYGLFLNKGGTGILSVDGKEVAKKTLEHTVPITFPEDETFDVGMDTRTPVSLVEYHYA